MAAGDFYALQATWQQPTTLLVAQNTFYFEQGTVVLVLDTPEEDLVEAFTNVALNPYQQCMHSNYQLIEIAILPLPARLVSYVDNPVAIIGGQGGDMLDPVSAGGLRFYSAHLGRRGRSHVFIGPVAESVNTSIGRPSGTETGVLTALGDALLAMNDLLSITSANWIWSVWSEADQAGYNVTRHNPSLIWYTQRNRKN